MKKSIFNLFITTILFLRVYPQFAPPAGQIGSTAIKADSSCFISWAIQCSIHRGYINISDTSFEYNNSNYATYGEDNWAIGIADNQAISFGDAGYAILEFNPPIANGLGWDFAVFENSLNDEFLEFAFVEVSSDGENYFRFPAISLTQTDIQTGAFGTTDATKINNLAGKYRALFGTPFNLDEIDDNALLDKYNVRFVKIIDVIGSINADMGSYDYQNNLINDPWPTPFNTCGFDLDAVGVINNVENTSIENPQKASFELYPNPCNQQILNIKSSDVIQNITIYSINGQMIKNITSFNALHNQINIDFLTYGLYIFKIEFRNYVINQLFIRI